ncbi:MAG: ADP-ribosylglycohydrolase family protein, partial [Candidatus Dormibacteria bacterium]
MWNPVTSPAAVRSHAQGLLLGLALGEAAQRRGPDPTARLTGQATALAEALLARGRPEPADLLARWLALSQACPERPGSITGEVLRLFAVGLPATGLARAVAGMVPERSGDSVLSRCLPVALACHDSGGTLRAWVQRCAAATHAEPIAQLAAIATAMLARDLLTRPLEDCLPRVAQALREESPESFIAILHAPRPGTGMPGGDDAQGVLAASIQALCDGRDWTEAVAIATSRGVPGDTAPAHTGALAG